MSNVIVTEKEDGYLITMDAMIKGNLIVGCKDKKVTIFVRDYGIWAQLMFEINGGTRGLVKIEIDDVEYTVTDPLWRNLFEAFDFYVMKDLEAARKKRKSKNWRENLQYLATDGYAH